MNIIYLLKNLKNNRSYIGQKVECRIEKINNIDTIINNKTELPYFGSSSNIEMIEDLKRDKFEATILEVVKNRKEMCKREDYYIRKYNAVNSPTFYNLSYPLDYNKRDFQNSVKNEFGETYKEYASNESSISKRINSAKNIGFNTLEEFYIDVCNKYKITQNCAEIARIYNVERHTISRLIKDVDLIKFQKEINIYDKELKNKIIDLRVKGASIKKISKILYLEFATVLYYIGTKHIKKRNYIVAKRKGLSEDELGYQILKFFLEGENIKEISLKLNITERSTTRYFHRFIRKHIKINDFNRIINNE